MRPSARDRGYERTDLHALGLGGNGGECDPGIGERPDGLGIGDVVPDEETVPTTPLGLGGELGDESGLGELLEGSDEDGAAGLHPAHSLGMRIQRAM